LAGATLGAGLQGNQSVEAIIAEQLGPHFISFSSDPAQTENGFWRYLLTAASSAFRDYGSAVAAFVALIIFGAGRWIARRELQSEARSLAISYIQPLNEILRQAYWITREGGPLKVRRPFEVPAIFSAYLGRNWIMADDGVALSYLYGRINAYNSRITLSPETIRGDPQWREQLNDTLVEIETVAKKLCDRFQANQTTWRMRFSV
jgi:hypothetical protein